MVFPLSILGTLHRYYHVFPRGELTWTVNSWQQLKKRCRDWNDSVLTSTHSLGTDSSHRLSHFSLKARDNVFVNQGIWLKWQLSFEDTTLLGLGTSLVVQWLRLHSLSAEGTGLIPSQGTKIPHTKWHDQKKRNLYLNFYTFASLVLVWLHSNPLLLFSACAYFQLLQFLLVSICHFSPLCLGFNDSLMGISHNSSLSLCPLSMFFPLSICSLFFLVLFFECLFHRSAPTSSFFWFSSVPLLILLGHFPFPSLTSHRPTSLCLSVLVSVMPVAVCALSFCRSPTQHIACFFCQWIFPLTASSTFCSASQLPWLIFTSLSLFLVTPCSIWDLCSLSRDWTHAPCIGSAEL